MRVLQLIILTLLFVAPALAEDRKPSRFTVGKQTYEFSLSKDDLTRTKWDFQSSDSPPLSPRAAYAKAKAALAALRPANENWESVGFDLSLTSATSAYSLSFILMSEDRKKRVGFLPFIVLMDGTVIAPKATK